MSAGPGDVQRWLLKNLPPADSPGRRTVDDGLMQAQTLAAFYYRTVTCRCRNPHPCHAATVYSLMTPLGLRCRRSRTLSRSCDGCRELLEGCGLAEGAVRPVGVVVVLVVAKHAH